MRNVGPLARQDYDQIGDAANEIFWLLAKCHAEDAVAERILNLRIVTQRVRKGRLSKAASATKGCCDCDWLAPCTQKLLLDLCELLRPLDEAGWQRIRHERHALLAGRASQTEDQPVSAFGNVDVVAVGPRHPARQVRKVKFARSRDGPDGLAFLARQLPFVANIA